MLVLLALGLSHHHHVTVQFGVANYSPDADDADVMGRVVASSSESSSSAFERTLPAEATPRTMVQMMMAPEVETPQPVAEGDAQGLLAGGTHGGGLFGGKSKSSRARSTSSRKDGGRMDRMEVDKYMSSTMEDKCVSRSIEGSLRSVCFFLGDQGETVERCACICWVADAETPLS